MSKRDDFLVFGSPLIEEEEIDEVVACLRSGWLGTGPRAAEFETRFAAYKHAPHAVAVSSGSAALHLSLVAAGLEPGAEVITTPLTFCATVNAIVHAGLTPVLADVDPVTQNIDPSEVERRLTAKTGAILPVHLGGRPCDMDRLMVIARNHDLVVIEDCAHAIETEYRGRPAGTIGDFGCFSFYVTKNIVTGEGGMVLARRDEHAQRIKTAALHGLTQDAWKRFGDEGYQHYLVVDCGYKYNLTDLHAAIGIHQLQRIDRYWARRAQLWNQYHEALSGLPVTLPAPPEPDTRHAYHLFALLVDESRAGIARDAFLEAMTARGIGVGVHYLSIPEHPYYRETFKWNPEDYPNAMRIGRQTASIPLSPGLSDGDAQRVTEAVYSALHA